MLATESLAKLIVSRNMSEQGESREDRHDEIDEGQLDAILKDPRAKAALLKKMGLEDQEDGRNRLNQPPTPSGTSAGGWPSYPPVPYWPNLYPPFPMGPAAGQHVPTYGDGRGARGRWAGMETTLDENEEESGPSTRVSDGEDEDAIDLLSESEALQLVEFDPKVKPADTWDPPQTIIKFLDRHFNRALTEEERDAIMKDFPRPNVEAVATPKLGGEVKDQLRSKGRDPHHGAEKALYKIQDQLLDAVGPLTCLWSDLLNKDAKVSTEDVLLLLQRALVLLGNTSHSINIERRKVAWAKMNPKLRNLGTENYEKRGTDLFGPGFLEKASKRIEVEKTLDKVVRTGQAQGNKRGRYESDKSDLRSFLSKGASVRCGNTKNCQPYPHSAFNKFSRGGRYLRQGESSQRFLNSKKTKDKPAQ